MTSRNQPIPFAVATVSTRAGVDPDEIDLPSEVYGDGLPFNIDDITHDCPKNDTGHIYKNVGGAEICIHCGEEFEP